ncbi:hypothetical protein GCM10027418_15270 [Mariniluteicoccus endophyticus]
MTEGAQAIGGVEHGGTQAERGVQEKDVGHAPSVAQRPDLMSGTTRNVHVLPGQVCRDGCRHLRATQTKRISGTALTTRPSCRARAREVVTRMLRHGDDEVVGILAQLVYDVGLVGRDGLIMGSVYLLSIFWTPLGCPSRLWCRPVRPAGTSD